MENILTIENISKYYGNKSNLTKAISNISMNVDKGEFIAIMGASGSGKTTLLNVISTIDKVTSGHIYIEGQDITKLKGNDLNRFRREELGFIFQDFNLLDSLTIFENIAVPLTLAGKSKVEIKAAVAKIAKRLDVEQILNKYPSECSGGQRQRAAICRALVTNPKIIVADEPTGNLDSKNSHELLSLFRDLNINDGVSILMVTHDSKIASYSSKLLYIKDGVIDETIERKDMSQKEYFYKIVDINSTESQALFD